MSWKCPSCGFETDLAPLAFKQSGPMCPLCGKQLPPAVTEETPNTGLRWIEQEHPAFFDRLMDKRDHRIARRRTVRRVVLAVGLVLGALLVYVLVV